MRGGRYAEIPLAIIVAKNEKLFSWDWKFTPFLVYVA
jgi:hypothetical protein